ncbi:dTDP-4-dehydrorhamnose 3,5-epimerase family protein [Herbaspirillum huttiense F1]|uniref:dTDP-4-dehydrorhamnose 3,5-epimerase family protein n=1 Tax=Herbaspirillum huttiense TaxID=863372 RepID=UPI002883A6EA|nr:dTDP-4-dehydrorhamnose 3,5-epimerase family protein [Herbaspirillum huttiense]MDT0359125.1 dTDP-4-dehydrorhamnose 3,5-epimerase family protein [Herbaspirillum huttiense F1]
MNLQITPTGIAGAAVVSSVRRGDARGSFARWFCDEELAPVLQGSRIVQVNNSFTAEPGSVRGMHFQHAPHAEKKLIRCLAGRVFDVVLDLRKGSPTFLQWRGVELAAGDDRALLVPEGCAHGFQVLEAGSSLLYLHTAPYVPHAEGGVRHDDPRVAIAWPLPPQNLSPRDLQHPPLAPDFDGIPL